MKITAELKGEFSEWLDTYWKTYLSGDLDLGHFHQKGFI